MLSSEIKPRLIRRPACLPAARLPRSLRHLLYSCSSPTHFAPARLLHCTALYCLQCAVAAAAAAAAATAAAAGSAAALHYYATIGATLGVVTTVVAAVVTLLLLLLLLVL